MYPFGWRQCRKTLKRMALVAKDLARYNIDFAAISSTRLLLRKDLCLNKDVDTPSNDTPGEPPAGPNEPAPLAQVN